MCCKLANPDYINEKIGTGFFLCNEMQADKHKGGGLVSQVAAHVIFVIYIIYLYTTVLFMH